MSYMHLNESVPLGPRMQSASCMCLDEAVASFLRGLKALVGRQCHHLQTAIGFLMHTGHRRVNPVFSP